MSYIPRYDKGDWKALCDVCGREYKASQLQQRWDGLMCCTDDWEIRQPQDFVRGVADNQLAPWTRPEPTDSFVPITIGMLMIVDPVFARPSLPTPTIKPPVARPVLTATVSITATLIAGVTHPIGPGARQLNGSPINNNTIN